MGVAEPDARWGLGLLPILWNKTPLEGSRQSQEPQGGLSPERFAVFPSRVASGNGPHGLSRYGELLRCDPRRGSAWPPPAGLV